MKSTLLFCLLLVMLQQSMAQNPLIVKTVTGAPLEPESDYLLNHRTKPWNGKLFYQGKGSSPACNLVMTDGTAAGTVLIKDLANGSGINGIYPAQDFVYVTTLKSEFVSFSPLVVNWVRELWRTDGTAAGTYRLKLFDATTSTSNTGVFSSDALSSVNYSVAGNTIFFNGYDATNGAELWKSDGTVGGTVLVKDIISGTTGGHPFGFCHVGGTTLFFGRSALGNYQLWQTDGTAAGTQQLITINPSAQSIAEFSCGLYKGKMWFWANDGTNGAEVWYSDGTQAGTQMLKDFIPGNNAFTGSGGFRTDLAFVQDDNYLYFPIERSKYVWRTDGTTAGTVQLNSMALTSANIAGASARGKGIYWQDNVNTLYRSNGTAAGTAIVRTDLVQAVQLYQYKGAAWFAARLPNNSDVEPWRSDGTAANTARALDIDNRVSFGIGASSSPYNYFELNNYLYFFATNASGVHLFRYNGDFTFNNSVSGGRWRDSANWNSAFPPGNSDTAYIPAGVTIHVDGRSAHAGRLVMGSGSTLNLVSTTDSLYIAQSLQGGSTTGAGVVSLRSISGDTVQVQSAFSANNVAVQGAASLGGTFTINASLNLTAAARLLANNFNLVFAGATSTITNAANSYIVTNGTGSVAVEAVGSGGRTGGVLYPIGTSTNYNPVTLTNSGTADVLSARVQPVISNLYSGDGPSGGSYTGGAVNATWYINEGTAGGSNVAVALQWNAAQELPSFDRTASRLGHFTGGTWQLNTPGAPAGTNPYTFSGSGYSSFSPFGVLNSNAVLPIRRITLSVQKTGGANRLTWGVLGDGGQTVVLEKSPTGLVFTPAYTTTYSATGNWNDASPMPGKTYYRLKVVDGSGQVRYSNVVWVDASATTTIYPTLFSNTLQVQYNGSSTAVLRLTSSNGQVVLQQSLLPGTNTMATNELVKGSYFYQVMSEGQVVAKGIVVKP